MFVCLLMFVGLVWFGLVWSGLVWFGWLVGWFVCLFVCLFVCSHIVCQSFSNLTWILYLLYTILTTVFIAPTTVPYLVSKTE